MRYLVEVIEQTLFRVEIDADSVEDAQEEVEAMSSRDGEVLDSYIVESRVIDEIQP